MRILFLTYEIQGAGGSWMRSSSLARGLVQGGHEVTLWCARPRGGAPPAAPDGLRVERFPGALPDRLRHAGIDPAEILARRLRARRAGPFDVVHGFGHRPSVAWVGRAMARRLGVPWIADWADLWGMEGIGGRRRGLSRWLFGPADTHGERRVYAAVDGLSVITRDLARRARAFGLAEERIRRVAVGADVDGIVPRDRREMRHRHGVPQDAPVACYVGFNSYDGAFLGRAFAALHARQPEARLLLVGAPMPELDAVVASAGLADRVLRHGVVPHERLNEHLACADVMLLPYLDRPINRGRYPHKLGDYLAAGRPTVTNPTGDLKDLVADEAVGLLAEESPEAFATAVDALLSDPDRAERMGKRARRLAEQRLSWRAIAADLADFYAERARA